MFDLCVWFLVILNSLLTVTFVQVRKKKEAGAYECVAENGNGDPVSATADLTVYEGANQGHDHTDDDNDHDNDHDGIFDDKSRIHMLIGI